MPDTTSAIVLSCNIQERQLRALKRNIIGILEEGKAAVENPAKIPIFKAKLNRAEADWQQFQKTWDERDALQAQLDDPQAWPDKKWLEEYAKVREEICLASACLISIEEARRPASPQQRAHQEQAAPQMNDDLMTSFAQVLADSHLPKVNIPIFSGDLLQWSHFKDTFTSMVHEEPSLTNIKRFHYLRSALRGEAAVLINRITMSENSYAQAWEKLLKTYDNPRVLASAYVKRILDCDVKSQKTDLQRYECFLNDVADGIEGFRNLELHDKCDFLLASLALRALDQNTRNQFELAYKSQDQVPKADDVIDFVRKRMTAMKMAKDDFSSSSTMSSTSSNFTSNKGDRYPKRQSSRYNPVALHMTEDKVSKQKSMSPKPKSSTGANNFMGCSLRSSNHALKTKTPHHRVCPFCQGNHDLCFCYKFSDLSSERRAAFVKGWKGCRNCLKEGHSASVCTSRWNCRYCKQRHHSLIHVNEQKQSLQNTSAPATEDRKQCEHSDTFIGFGSTPSSQSVTSSMVLLGTVQLLIKDHRGSFHSARAVLDSGSQNTFITSQLAHLLGFRLRDFDKTITGLGGSTVTKPAGIVTCHLRAHSCPEEIETQAIVVSRISPTLPSRHLDDSVYHQLAQNELADRSFDVPGAIDVLIGADIYPLVVNGAPQKSSVADLYLLPTIFGQAVIGCLDDHTCPQTVVLYAESNQDIDNRIKAFWELEEPVTVDRTHPDDKYCEDHFLKSFTRSSDGRYVVRLPVKPEYQPLKDNREVATRRFLSLERKLSANTELAKKYVDFMQEYAQMGHMSQATSSSSYIIPHHGVQQSSKLRVVFDASCATYEDSSLNNILLTGPKLQKDICLILIRFLLYLIPLCADLVKMYRQIIIHPSDRHLQHIFWRKNPNSALQEWELNTVTYGLRSSPFQALRVISQLIQDEGSDFPLAADRATNDMFVDDIVTGADSIQEALQLKEQLCAMFARGFELSKWASTDSSLLPDTGEGKLEPKDIRSDSSTTEDTIKILGLMWDPASDSFSYRIQLPSNRPITKRVVLSSIARIYDPLGFLSPVIFLAKVLMQDIWKANLGWDDILPPQLCSSWHAIFAEWGHLKSVKIPRYATDTDAKLQLIGFCDASTRGYAAAVYLRSESPEGHVKVSLVKAKTKVAPTKYVSIARLELCAALLLSRLLFSVKLTGYNLSKTQCFTDSSNVLSWLKLPSYALKVFEANRVNEIRSIISEDQWNHIKSEENPCDIASRGCVPSAINGHLQWWHGPSWLINPQSEWPKSRLQSRPHNVLLASSSHKPTVITDKWMERFSSLNMLIRTVARLLRFKEIIRPTGLPIARPISADDYRNAKLRCVKIVQQVHFNKDLFQTDADVPKEYRQLSPFLDNTGIVRVGGRLQESSLSYSAKHPILIPSSSYFSKLLIDDIHTKHFHAGPSLTLALLRGEFWITRSPKLIRGRILRCVECRKRKAKSLTPLMAPLPKERFSQYRAFLNIGVDYAGPFAIKESSRRKAALGKAYLCIFVCLATKAVHLEAVSQLTTVAFLAAFDRFTSRRGLPNTVWSDNGTNFVGAARFMKDVFTFLRKEEGAIISSLAPSGIQWKFIPPRSPHFGGIWEAGVKSVKALLTGSVGSSPYTFEELSTAFIKIEGLLNSRPLYALNENAEDFDFLTPVTS